MNSKFCNIGLRLRDAASRLPNKTAVAFPAARNNDGTPHYAKLTFHELDRESDAFARGFNNIGITRGTKTLVMVKPSLEFFSIMFALFKAGAVPILIDPGMGKERLLQCIHNVNPEAFIGIPLAHMARIFYPKFFGSVRIPVTVGRRWLWGGYKHSKIKEYSESPFSICNTLPEELAAILFTTGSTGPAKGVEYEHGMFEAQCEILRKTYSIDENDIDLPTFPPFALFSVGLGMTAVIPDMDPTRPAHVNPKHIIEAIVAMGCTFSFGSPALWGKVTQYCVDHEIKLPTLRKVLMAGAPVPPNVHERFTKILSEGAETNTPYGATESLPSANMIGKEVLVETASLTSEGAGFCVGYPVHGVEIKIIHLSDDPIPVWANELEVAPKIIGEITVTGRNITKSYHNNPEANAIHKIQDGVEIWHRIGDMGYFDDKGRLWFCGRKNHRVETTSGILYTVCCEAIFNNHPQVKRSALVGLGKRPNQKPVIIIEPIGIKQDKQQLDKLRTELLTLASNNDKTKSIQTLLFHFSFPVDIRHNAKINRELLTGWATKEFEK